MNFIKGRGGDRTAARIRRNVGVLCRNGGKKGVIGACLDRHKTFQRLVMLPAFVPELFGRWIFLLINNNYHSSVMQTEVTLP